jgi:predicted alpha/beta superfamily hydrolase
MIKAICSLIVLVISTAHLSGLASEKQGQIHELMIDSEVMREKRELIIYLPGDYDTSEVLFPVLYVTDGDIQGPHTAGSIDYLSKFDQVPNMIVVGIANPRHLRERDLTLTAKAQEKVGQVEGADRFLQFIESEVIPFIRERYRTLDYQAISGTSHGGQFAINTMIKKPGLFNGAIAISPTLYWDDQQLLRLSESAFKKQSLHGRLYVSIANEEPIMTVPYQQFLTLAQQYANSELLIASQVFNQESHNSTALLGQYYGLKHLFSDWAIPDTPQTLTDLQAIYSKRSALLSTALTIPEDRANGYGQWLQYSGRQEEALDLFQWNRETYPKSINTHKALISAHLYFGHPDDAKLALSYSLEVLEGLSEAEKQSLRALVSND